MTEEENICGSEIREKTRRAIIKKCKEDPLDRFRILNRNGKIIEVFIKWDEVDTEILSVKI